MTDDNESYVAIPWDVVVKRCDEQRKSIERDREAEERQLYERWVARKSASRWHRLWRRPPVTVEDAKAYYEREAQSSDVFYWDPVWNARNLYSRQYDLAATVRRMAQLSRNVDGKVLLSRSDFELLNF